jgi:tagatose-6-phosphate ketose/aldose isomerase
VQIVDKHCLSCYHLIITCDKQGELAQYASVNKQKVIVLPPESNDKSLAMTGSYSGMLLAGLLLANIKHLEETKEQIDLLITYGNKILNDYQNPLQIIAQKSFSRSVFLGSGPLFGTATESTLKLQELTDGSIICKSESYLGFRHGPKAVIDKSTLICYLISNDSHIQNYEYDLINAMHNGHKPMAEIAVCEGTCLEKKFELLITLSSGDKKLEEEFLSVCYVLPGQIIAFYKSLSLGYKPDNPSISGAISRVVEGVKIYNKEN